uniref:Uncharacterized protein n=1 Tax=Kuenenia stuttgartiensis TaxID=174633 RepID=Q1PVW3_KUEST|nr:unknown protein [Candidatus Kuenenia stuttgartiensis]
MFYYSAYFILLNRQLYWVAIGVLFLEFICYLPDKSLNQKILYFNRLSGNRYLGKLSCRKSFNINTRFFGFCIPVQP